VQGKQKGSAGMDRNAVNGAGSFLSGEQQGTKVFWISIFFKPHGMLTQNLSREWKISPRSNGKKNQINWESPTE